MSRGLAHALLSESNLGCPTVCAFRRVGTTNRCREDFDPEQIHSLGVSFPLSISQVQYQTRLTVLRGIASCGED